MTDTEAAYLAGLIDGEGTIVISDRRATRPNGRRPQIIVGVVGSSLAMHAWLTETVGAGHPRPMTVYADALVKPNRTVYQWRIVSTTAVGVLRQVLPYMVEKRDRAELALRCHNQGYSALDAA